MSSTTSIRPDIAHTALAVFTAHGYDCATMREVAGRAGMRVSSPYTHVTLDAPLVPPRGPRTGVEIGVTYSEILLTGLAGLAAGGR